MHIHKQINLDIQYDISLLDEPDKVLFFDIETTGLSPYESALYLIGSVYRKENSWYLDQWFCESLKAELPILKEFFAFAEGFNTLVHFNGDTFDIRYLAALAEQYSLPEPLTSMHSVDILKRTRKCKCLFGLPNLRQKTIESFLGLDREDIYNGGELIEVYERYTKNQDPKLLHFLLLHNEEDLLGMPGILSVLTYSDAFSGADFTIEDTRYSEDGKTLYVKADFTFSFPVKLKTQGPTGQTGWFYKNTMQFALPVFQTELLYFYPNFKDYYYLPDEDMAVHKKLAVFVDKDHRVPATAATCYTRIQSVFSYELPKSKLTSFYKDASKEKGFQEVNPENDSLKAYLKVLITHLKHADL